MRTKLFATSLVLIIALIAAGTAFARPGNGDGEFVPVTLCHATGSATHPYEEITVDNQGAYNGHTHHGDDIIPAPAGGCPTGEDDGDDNENDNDENENDNDDNVNDNDDPGGQPTPVPTQPPSTDITFDASVDPEVVRNADGDIVDAVGQCFRFGEDVTLVLFHYDGRNSTTGEFDGGPHTDWSQFYPAGSSLCHVYVGELTTPNSGNAFYMMTANGILLSINGDATYEGVTAADWDDGHAFNPLLSGVVAGELYVP